MEWKEYNICQLCDTISETYKGKSNTVVLINTSDVLEGKVLNHKRVPNKGLKGQFKKTFKKNDILYSEIRPANKRFAYINFSPNDYIASTKLMVLRSKPIVSSHFLFQILKSEIVLKKLQTLAESRSGTFPQITYSELSNVRVKVPPLPVQDKIVGILSALDSKIENNNKINANLEAQAQALFKSWFVDFTPFKDQPFVDSELGPIPQGWKVGKLGDIALQSTEKVLTRNDVKVLSPITTGKLVLSEEYFTKQVFSKSIRNYKIVKQGAFAYNPARVNIGSLGMNEFKFDGCVSPVYVVFECLKGYNFFFDLFRKTEFFKQAVISFAIGGVRQTLNYSDFALIDATIPPLNIVQSFNEIYLRLKKKISINEEENQRLAALRDTLLPKLMSGEIKI